MLLSLPRAGRCLTLLLFAVSSGISAQEAQGFSHPTSEAQHYVWPTDTAVLEKLQQWQNLKFGVLLHWGLYSVPGIVESWSICSEDVDWIRRRPDMSYEAYKRWYYSLADSLCPRHFEPREWAALFRETGMRYVVFTTKHHDGFCLYDSRLTDFSIARGPFRSNPKGDAARFVFQAFRERGFMVGAYFSKPDWHCPFYWSPRFATPNRRENYRRERHPDLWQQYVAFTSGQLTELLSRYGRLDLLWLDGGWVSGEEIGLDSVLSRARSGSQPGLLCVDRTVGGRNENYLTPERGIPAEPLGVPWEACLPLTDDWGWTPRAHYKSARTVVSKLMEIVAKGGSLLLGVGPTADGTIDDSARVRLTAVGDWLKRNGEAIYATVPTPCYHDGRFWFTASKDGRTRYALYALPDGEELPAKLTWHGNLPGARVTLLNTGRRIPATVRGDSVTITLPRDLRAEPLALKFHPREASATITGLKPNRP